MQRTLPDDLSLSVVCFSRSVLEFPSHYVVGLQVGKPCTCREYSNSWLPPHIIIQALLHGCINIMCRSVIYRHSAMRGPGQWVEQCNLTMLGVQVLSNRASGKNIHWLPSPSSTSSLSFAPSLSIQCLVFASNLAISTVQISVLVRIISAQTLIARLKNLCVLL